MEPTIGQGDGYVIGPAGDVSVGDIIVFDSEHREEYVTHRVVEVTDEGYITKGDNNPSTDQASGHPVVAESSVLGSVVGVGSHPIVIPRLATVAAMLSTYWPLGVLAVLLGGSFIERNPRARDVVRVDDLMTPLVVTVVVGSALALTFSAPTYEMGFTAVAGDDSGGQIIPIGESVTRTFAVERGPAFTHQFVEGAGVTVIDVAATGDAYDVTVDVPARSSRGSYEAAVTTHHYPAVLPYGVARLLHDLHPFAASLASIGTIIAPLYAGHWLLVDGQSPIETRSRSRGSWWESR